MDFTTKSVVVNNFGGYDCLSVQKFPLPPLENNVEVDVHFCGINFADLYTRLGVMSDKKLPFVLGMECSGVVTAVGTTETSLKVGDRVICYDFNGGMHSNVVRISPLNCYPLPDDISFEDGASIFVNYLTAYFSIFELGHLKPNQNILIFSCAGGVGFAATQLAKTLENVQICGVLSKGKEAEATKNGVHKTFNYEQFGNEILEEVPEGFDLILINQSGSLFNQAQNYLKPLGRIVLIGGNDIIGSENKVSFYDKIKMWWTTKPVSLLSLVVNNRVMAGLHLGTLIMANRKTVTDVLSKLFDMLRNNTIKPKIHRISPVEDVVEATKILAERRNVGKILLSMK